MLTIEERIAALEKHSHKPFDFTDLIERLKILESIACTCKNAIDSCPVHGLGPVGREDRGA